MHDPSPLLIVNDLRKRFDADGPWVLNGVELRVPVGEHLAIVGPRGVGSPPYSHYLARSMRQIAAVFHSPGSRSRE